MKKVAALILAVILMTAFSRISFAQMPGADNNAPILKGEGNKEFSPENFNEIKSMILKRIEERSKRLSEEKACVEAAKDIAELKKCKPERPDGPGGPGQQKFQKPPMGQPR